MRNRIGIGLFIAVVIVAAAAALYWWHGGAAGAAAAAEFKTTQEADNVYVRFDMEAYDDIVQSYWQPGKDGDFAQLFQLALAKAAGTSSEPLATTTRDGVVQMLSSAFSGLSTTSQEKLATQTVAVALYNLSPTGRSNLLSSAAQQQLKNTVENVTPGDDLYADLGVSKDADAAAISAAAAAKSAALAATTSDAGKAALALVKKAAATLTNPTNKAIYDKTGAQATVFSHILNPHTLYLDISSVAPSTIDEFAAAVDAASTTPALTNLIIDVRGNIGGALDFGQEFLALFFGQNQYGFDLYQQGNLLAQRTGGAAQSKTLSQFKEIAVLTDAMSQSTAELVASALKHDRLAYTVGTTTRGWGSVESIIPMKTSINPNETYALELVEYLTVRYDGLPVEGNGVAPDVDVSSANWRAKLPNYFSSGFMVSAIEQAIARPPMQQ